MSTTPGVFSETLLQDVRVKMAEMLLDSRVKQQFIPQADILKALARVTTAKMRQLDAREKDYDVELEWVNVCGPEVESFTACTFGGDKASTNTKKYSLSYDKAVNFTISEADFVTNDFNFDEVFAKQFLRADVLLMEDFAKLFVTRLNQNKGDNAYTTGYTVSGGDTLIPAVNWSSNLISYFMMASKINKFGSPILIDGGNLYQSYVNAKFNSGNDDGKGAQAAYNNMDIFFDLFNPLSVNGDIKTDYLVDTGAYSWANKVYHTPVMTKNQDGLIKFSQPSKFGAEFLPLNYDVAMKPACTDNNLTSYEVNVRLKADIFANPTGCDEDNTGTLAMICS